MSNTLKRLSMAQTVRGTPTPKDDDETVHLISKGVVPRTHSKYLKCYNQVLTSSKEIN